jgi:hypothetical protein
VLASLDNDCRESVELEEKNDGVLAREKDGNKCAHVEAKYGGETQRKEWTVLEDEGDEDAPDLGV